MKRGHLRKALTIDGDALVITVDATALVQEQMARLGVHPAALIHLGQGLLSVLLLQSLGDPDENDRVQAEWLCKGDFGHMYAEAMGNGLARGTIGVPQAPAETMGRRLGDGVLRVRRHHAGSVNTGMVPSVGDVSVDLVEYLQQSEQRSCGSGLSVKIEWVDDPAPGALPFRVKSARGFLVHVLPAESKKKRDACMLRWDAQIRALGAISQWALDGDAQATTLDMLRMLLSDENPRVLFECDTELFCTCSDERAGRAVALLRASDREVPSGTPDGSGPMAFDGHVVTCEFCGATYRVD